MPITIKHRYTDAVLFTSDTATTAKALAEAVKSRADLSRADLSRAYLSRAYLSRAYLSGADLSGAKGLPLGMTITHEPADVVPTIPNIHSTLLAAVTREGCKLDMNQWHSCDTTHCRAGWVVTLAGEAGKALEDKFGTPRAASMIYRKSDPGCRVPHWYATDERAMAEIRECAEREAAKP